MEARYINPYTDFGFAKLFAQEASKELLKDFLNQLLPPQHQIVELSLTPTIRLPEAVSARAAVFDIYCQSASGERFIVEMQKAKQIFFKDRTIFYSTFPIRDQAIKGDWTFQLSAVYCVGILDFEFDSKRAHEEVTTATLSGQPNPIHGAVAKDGIQELLTTVKLKDQHGQVFYDKLTFIYLQMPLFTKTEDELVTHFDKWLYFLKHLNDFDEIPGILREPVFEQGFHIAELASYSQDERDFYERSLKAHRDYKNGIDCARAEGRAEGIEQGIEQGIEKAYALLLDSGMAPEAARALLKR